jgi:hypothetical protein
MTPNFSGSRPLYYVPTEPHSHPCECTARPSELDTLVHRHRHHHHHHQNVWSSEDATPAASGSSSRGNYEWYRPRRLRPPESGDLNGGASANAAAGGIEQHQPHSCPDPHCRVRNDVRDRQGKKMFSHCFRK